MVYKIASNPCGHGNLDHADYFLFSTTKSVGKKYEHQLYRLNCIVEKEGAQGSLNLERLVSNKN
jgi:hypothetical protein